MDTPTKTLVRPLSRRLVLANLAILLGGCATAERYAQIAQEFTANSTDSRLLRNCRIPLLTHRYTEFFGSRLPAFQRAAKSESNRRLGIDSGFKVLE
jgi:hypothetical protein